MRFLKIIGNCLFGFIAISLLLLLFFSFMDKKNDIPKIGNYSLLEVKGTSMDPKIKNGDLIFIDREKKDKYEVGNIVSFISDDGSVITHKIVKVEEENGSYRYFTKGVNNSYQDNDYIEIKQIIGEYKNVRIPLLGYVVGFASKGIGYILLVILPLALIFIYVMVELFKEISKKERR